jgi:hypothetical protein
MVPAVTNAELAARQRPTSSTTRARGRHDRSPGEDQEQTLAAGQRVRGNITPHPEVNGRSLREPVKSASRPFGMAYGHT